MGKREIILLGTTNKPPLVSFQPLFFRGNVVYVVVIFYQQLKHCQYHRQRRFSAYVYSQRFKFRYFSDRGEARWRGLRLFCLLTPLLDAVRDGAGVGGRGFVDDPVAGLVAGCGNVVGLVAVTAADAVQRAARGSVQVGAITLF